MTRLLLLLLLVGCGPDEVIYIGIPGASPDNVVCGKMQGPLLLCVRKDQPSIPYQCAEQVDGGGFSKKTRTRVCAEFTGTKPVTPERAP